MTDAVADGCKAFGLEFVRADDPNVAGDLLWERVRSCMEACQFGIAVFETIREKDINPNVSLELGYMLSQHRDLMLLKEKGLRHLQSDLCGHLYKSFDSSNVAPTVLGQMAEWFKSNRVRKNDHEKLVVFVSYGGIDRCAIAKVITRYLLRKNRFTNPVRIESRAAFEVAESGPAPHAVEVVRKRLREDLLSDHRPRRAGPAFLFEADLILATDNEVLSKVRNAHAEYPGSKADCAVVRAEIASKSHLISEFFRGSGDIADPYRQNKAAYLACFDDLYARISRHYGVLEEFLEREKPPKVRSVPFGNRRLDGTVR